MSFVGTFPLDPDVDLTGGSLVALVCEPGDVDRAGFQLRSRNISIRDCLVVFLGSQTRFCLLGMKDTSKTFHELAVRRGVSLLDIDPVRIPTNDSLSGGLTSSGKWKADGQGSSMGYDRPWMHDEEKVQEVKEEAKKRVARAEELGRYPPNLLLDAKYSEIIDEQSFEMGIHGAGKARLGSDNPKVTEENMFGVSQNTSDMYRFGDEGGASRFFNEVNTEDELIGHLEKMLGVKHE